MTHAIDVQQHFPQKLQQFQEFVFVSDLSLKLVPKLTTQLQLDPDSGFLNKAKIGDFMTIKQIHVSRNARRQLRNLEFKPEQKVRLVSKTDNGSVIVNLNNTLLGIGKEIAQRIVVTLVGA